MFLRRFVFPLAIVLLGAVSSAQSPVASSPGGGTITNKDVVSMVSMGLSPEIVKAKIASSRCEFDTSPKALSELKSAGVPDAVVVAILESKPAPHPPPIPAAVIARNQKIVLERQDAQVRCPGCAGVLIANFDSGSGVTTDNWMSKNQLAYLKERLEKARKDTAPHRYWFTRYRENADFVIVWSSAVGYRPVTTYVPQTTTSTTQVSGDVNATAQTSSTSYVAEHGEHEFVNVVAAVYSKDGQKLFQSVHQGNWRWSKPDKDCLDDALNYLVSARVAP